MFIIAHALWGVAIMPNDYTYRSVFEVSIFSILPDLIWGPFMLIYILLGNKAPKSWQDAPHWFYILYNLAHSLVLWIVILAVLAIFRLPIWWIFFVLLHIVLDIPGHINFSTAFLFPISNFQYKGKFSWEQGKALILSFLIPIVIIGLRVIAQTIVK